MIAPTVNVSSLIARACTEVLPTGHPLIDAARRWDQAGIHRLSHQLRSSDPTKFDELVVTLAQLIGLQTLALTEQRMVGRA
jgi:hypothetical protein